jgi:hypothetical protein
MDGKKTRLFALISLVTRFLGRHQKPLRCPSVSSFSSLRPLLVFRTTASQDFHIVIGPIALSVDSLHHFFIATKTIFHPY